jgi:hypothetical protein
MQQIRMGRIAGVLGAVVVAGLTANRDAVALMLSDVNAPDYTLHPVEGQTRIDTEASGLTAVLGTAEQLRFSGFRPSAQLPMSCEFDARKQASRCRSHEGNAQQSSAVSYRLRDASGNVQERFDPASTDTVLAQSAYTSAGADSSGRTVSRTQRSTRVFAGLSDPGGFRTLNGADTAYASKQFGTIGTARMTKVTTYSGVTMSNRPDAQFPAAGVVYTSWHDTFESRSNPRDRWRNLIVWFDGTRNPEAIMNGQRYTVDLVTEIATPLPIR